MSTAKGAPAGRSWLSFLAWVVVGAAYALGILALLTIGPFVLMVAAVATAALCVSRWGRRGTPGLVSGLALPLLYVAYLNRGGPGDVCTYTADGSGGCFDAWSPWPWAAAGLALLCAGALLFNRQHPQP